MRPDMKCKDCKFLGEPYVHMRWSQGDEPDIETPYHVCNFVKHINEGHDVPTGDVGVIDGSGYYAALVVRDDFGCIHFEPKE
jgi:hypothetical protein